MANYPWNDEKRAEARRRWQAGESATQIAAALYIKGVGPSRNAVIGIITRSGLQRSPEGVTAALKAAHVNRGRQLQAPTVKPQGRNPLGAHTQRAKPVLKLAGCGAVFEEPVARPPIEKVRFKEGPGGLRIIDPGFGGCRWPLSGAGDDTRFCCGTIERGRYCATHAARAFSTAAKPPPSAKELARSLRRFA